MTPPTPAATKRPVFTDIQERALKKIFRDETERPSVWLRQEMADSFRVDLSKITSFFVKARRLSRIGSNLDELQLFQEDESEEDEEDSDEEEMNEPTWPSPAQMAIETIEDAPPPMAELEPEMEELMKDIDETRTPDKKRRKLRSASQVMTLYKRSLEVPDVVQAYGHSWKAIAMMERTGISTSAGHYVAYVRNEEGWLLLDDSRATQVDVREINMAAVCTIALEKLHGEAPTLSATTTPIPSSGAPVSHSRRPRRKTVKRTGSIGKSTTTPDENAPKPKFSCPVKNCGQTFSRRDTCMNHLAVHEGKFKCSHCGKAFQTAYHLRRREAAHTGERAYQCSACQRGFLQMSDLLKHNCAASAIKEYTISEDAIMVDSVSVENQKLWKENERLKKELVEAKKMAAEQSRFVEDLIRAGARREMPGSGAFFDSLGVINKEQTKVINKIRREEVKKNMKTAEKRAPPCGMYRTRFVNEEVEDDGLRRVASSSASLSS